MKKTAFLFIAILFVASNFIYAQQKEPMMSFEKTKHNFGAVKQDGGNVDYKFIFTNTGAKPIIIEDVTSSCGCTTPEWSKAPVMPGAKGFITASFNPKGRPGHFDKSITVKSNAKNSPITLFVTGEVGEIQKTKTQEYPNQIGAIRLNTLYANFADMKSNQKSTKKIKIYNPTQAPVKVGIDERYKANYLTVSISPETLQPEQEGEITITYDASLVNDWDYVRASLYLTIDGKRETRNRINVSAIIKEEFTAEQKKNPPVIEFEETEFNFGTLKQGESVDYTFKFKNTGKTPLYIRKTKASCGCTAVNETKDAIAPGESGTIKATFNSRGKRGKQNKVITVITNCPQPEYNKVLLRVKGEVLTD